MYNITKSDLSLPVFRSHSNTVTTNTTANSNSEVNTTIHTGVVMLFHSLTTTTTTTIAQITGETNK